MLGSLSSSVAARFARSLRESGATCHVVILLPESRTKELVLRAVAADWRAELVAYTGKPGDRADSAGGGGGGSGGSGGGKGKGKAWLADGGVTKYPRARRFRDPWQLPQQQQPQLHGGKQLRVGPLHMRGRRLQATASSGDGGRGSVGQLMVLGRPSSPKGAGEKLLRYWAALQYLERRAEWHMGRRVLLADCRDVVFQRDPFSIPHEPLRPLVVFMEDYLRNFNNSRINLGHVVPCFGLAAVHRVLLSPPRPVSCSGVTLGGVDAIKGYLRAMWAEMSSKRYSQQCLRHDQAFHNWLLWSGQLGQGVRAETAEEGTVNTVGWPEHVYRDRYGRVLNRAGAVAHIVHQFDRRKQLLDTLGARYALIEKPERPPRTAAPVDTAAPLATMLRGGGRAAAMAAAAASHHDVSAPPLHEEYEAELLRDPNALWRPSPAKAASKPKHNRRAERSPRQKGGKRRGAKAPTTTEQPSSQTATHAEMLHAAEEQALRTQARVQQERAQLAAARARAAAKQWGPQGVASTNWAQELQAWKTRSKTSSNG